MLKVHLSIMGVVVGCLSVFTWVANAIPQIQSDVPEDLVLSDEVTPEELIAAGEDLYNGGGGCTACHGLGERAPNLLTDHAGTGLIGERCADRVAGQDCKQYLHASLVDPNAYLVEGFAPIMLDASRTLSSVQIWALIAYLQSLGGEVTVRGADFEESGGGGGVTPLAGDARATTDPQHLMALSGCTACHLPAAMELPVRLAPPFDGIGSRMTTEEIRAEILDPNAVTTEGYEAFGGTMPTYFGERLTAAELEAIVRFLASLR